MKRRTLKARVNELIRYPAIIWMISNDPSIKSRGNSLEEQDLNYVVRRYWKFKGFHGNLCVCIKEDGRLDIHHIQNPGSKRYGKVTIYKDCIIKSYSNTVCNNDYKTVDVNFTAAPYRSDAIDKASMVLDNKIKSWITSLEE